MSYEKHVLMLHYLGGGIPDAAVIHAARKKREAARAAGGGNTADSRDYIPIKKKEEGRVKRGPRLVREEDEEEGEEDRVSFRLEQEDRQAEYHNKTAAVKSDSDSEPETWEKMQISKAINSQQVLMSFLLFNDCYLFDDMLSLFIYIISKTCNALSTTKYVRKSLTSFCVF